MVGDCSALPASALPRPLRDLSADVFVHGSLARHDPLRCKQCKALLPRPYSSSSVHDVQAYQMGVRLGPPPIAYISIRADITAILGDHGWIQMDDCPYKAENSCLMIVVHTTRCSRSADCDLASKCWLWCVGMPALNLSVSRRPQSNWRPLGIAIVWQHDASTGSRFLSKGPCFTTKILLLGGSKASTGKPHGGVQQQFSAIGSAIGPPNVLGEIIIEACNVAGAATYRPTKFFST